MFVEWLRNIFNPEAAAQKERAQFLDALEKFNQKDPRDIPLDIKCLTIQNLTRHILTEAEKDNLYTTNDVGAQRVDEAFFHPEVSTIIRLLKSIELSPALKEWAGTAMMDLAESLEQQFPNEQTKAAWPHLSHDEKEQLVNIALKKQAATFSQNQLAFSDIKAKFEEPPVEGLIGFIPFVLIDRDKFTLPNVVINDLLLEGDNYDIVMSNALHEGLHVILLQLARMYFEGTIATEHPLYHDAEILFETSSKLGKGHPTIERAYKNDPEENFVQSNQAIFDFSYFGEASLARLPEPKTPQPT